MHFAAPWLLVTLAAIPVVVLLHVLRIPGRRREVADLRLWQNVLRQLRPDATERLKRFDPLLLLELEPRD